MNLLLLDERCDFYDFSSDDPRVQRIRRLKNAEVCLGVLNGPRGIGRVVPASHGGVRIEEIRWERETHPSSGVNVLVGLPRPVDARRIIVSAASMGVASLGFVVFDRTPPDYAKSSILRAETVNTLLRDGLEQGFHTALPEFSVFNSLAEAQSGLPVGQPRFLLDPYWGERLLGEESDWNHGSVTLALGSERGFSPEEQKVINDSGWFCRHLGSSILRTETAVTAAITLTHRVSGYSSTAGRSVIRPD